MPIPPSSKAEGRQNAMNARRLTPGDLVMRVEIRIKIWTAVDPGSDPQSPTTSLYCDYVSLSYQKITIWLPSQIVV